MVISGNQAWQPITLRMATMYITGAFSPLGVTDFPSIMVKSFLATWPPAAVYFLLQRYFVQGMVLSGIKG
jgi:ABC-type glycerol-3-phosphate transport system permease component